MGNAKMRYAAKKFGSPVSPSARPDPLMAYVAMLTTPLSSAATVRPRNVVSRSRRERSSVANASVYVIDTASEPTA